MLRALDIATSFGATLARMGAGLAVGSPGKRPERPLELYDFEGCPYCRKVREALSVLDLGAWIYPCPKGGPHYREVVRERGGKYQFPYLVDPNTGVEMYESDDIVRYLFERYGDGEVPFLFSAPLADLSSFLANVARPARGTFYRKARAPEVPLDLWSFEASPFCRLVREGLSTLELPYQLHNVAKGSAHREAFVARSGRMMVPFLLDPNTGVEMFESADIVEYLEKTYAE